MVQRGRRGRENALIRWWGVYTDGDNIDNDSRAEMPRGGIGGEVKVRGRKRRGKEGEGDPKSFRREGEEIQCVAHRG